MENKKKRHGCLTTWLIFMMVINSGFGLFYLFMSTKGEFRVVDTQTVIENPVSANSLVIPAATLVFLGLICLFNVACSIALFKWKKWGFYGFLGSTVVIFIVNISLGMGIGSSLAGLVGVAILYGLLNLGKNNKAWSQLD